MKKWWEAGILLFAAAGFWGMIYPDLCFVQDVCGIEYVQEEEQEQAGEENQEGRDSRSNGEAYEASVRAGSVWEPDIYTRICEAGPEHIQVKSRLLEWFWE